MNSFSNLHPQIFKSFIFKSPHFQILYLAHTQAPPHQHISQAIQKKHLKPKFEEATVVASWERIVGPAIAKRTKGLCPRQGAVCRVAVTLPQA